MCVGNKPNDHHALRKGLMRVNFDIVHSTGLPSVGDLRRQGETFCRDFVILQNVLTKRARRQRVGDA